MPSRRCLSRVVSIRLLCLLVICLLGLVIKLHVDSSRLQIDQLYRLPDGRNIFDYQRAMDRHDNQSAGMVYYDHTVPLIWIGGVPRSGTTLARAMLEAHPDIRCGEETRVIPRVLGMHTQMLKSNIETERLLQAKVTEGVLNEALGAYILSIILNHGEPAKRYCNKDPFAIRSLRRISAMFPKSKYILMARDGRAVAHSIVSRKVGIKGFDTKTYGGALRDWNRAMESMYTLCKEVGDSVCLMVHYEQLVLHPKGEMTKILKFLGVPWSNSVLHHEQLIGKDGGISVSKRELSTDQISQPINSAALTKWVASFPENIRTQAGQLAPMLERLGYDPTLYPPNYGEPDKEVLNNNAVVNVQSQHSTPKAKTVKYSPTVETFDLGPGHLIIDPPKNFENKKPMGKRLKNDQYHFINE